MLNPSATGIAAANQGAGQVRVPFDETALKAWLATHVRSLDGPLTVAQFNGGQSNPTYQLTTPTGRYVLRRKPPGPLLKGAHDVLREARVQQGLSGSDVPVARILSVCEDEAVIGSAFYVMDMVDGRVFWDATFGDVPIPQRGAYFDEMNRVIAALHSVDFRAAGLGDYGKHGNYLARQISRWSRQYLDDADAGRDDNMDRLVDWLNANLPPDDSSVSLIHGDFRCDNMIFHRTEPRVLAVLDWELSTLGHPGADFAYHAMMYRMPAHIVAGMGGADVTGLGIPDEATYLDAYCRRRGLAGMPDYDFFIAFNFFRLAAIFHGIKGRVRRGTATSAMAEQRVQVLPELMALAWAQAEIADQAKGLRQN